MKVEEPDLSGSYTYSDYLTWKWSDMTELIRGRIFKMSPAPGSLHQKISGELFRQLANFLKGEKCQAFQLPSMCGCQSHPEKKLIMILLQ